MKISLNWIKDFVDLDGIETDELIKRFNLTTAEIEKVEQMGADTENVVFAKILSVENHPLSEKLHILKVDDGKEEPTQVVCGAPNVRVGMVTAFAQVGGKVAGHKIGKAKLAGVESFGMCCSEAELGIGSDDDGIMDIKEDVTYGASIKTLYPIDDVVFEIDNKSLTNRPDLWGHYGLAREFAVMFKRELKPLELDDLSAYNNLKKLNLNIESKNCFRYSSIAVENVTKKYSPMQMKIRLTYCGMRDINLLADITNYLMLEIGQPMHAFDLEKVNGICVCDAKKGQKLLTLEGEEHEIAEDSVVVCDSQKEPVAIAGIKGGLKASISDSTTSLLLESAVFDATAIRKASIKIGLRTDSSIRYEKSLDPENTIIAIARLLYILKKIDNEIKVVSSLTDNYSYKYPQITINTTISFIEKKIGENIGAERICEILKGLKFVVDRDGDNLVVKVPSFRATKDVSIKEDLVEEVARVFGYDNIVPKTVDVSLVPTAQIKSHTLEYEVKKLLCEKFGASEVHSYLWNYEDFNKEVGIESKSVVRLVDSSNSGQSAIRSEMLPTMIKFFSENRLAFENIKIFEIGRVCPALTEDKRSIEEKHLSVLFANKNKTEEELYFEMKSVVLSICRLLLKNENVSFENNQTSAIMHPVNSCSVMHNGEKIGEMGILHTAIKNLLDKLFNVSLLELNFDNLANIEPVEEKVKSVSKFQSVNLDFNFLVPKTKTYAEIESCIKEFKTKLNFAFKVKDFYESEKLGENYSVTFSITISANDRTLSGEEIEKLSQKFMAHMKEKGFDIK